MNKNLEMFMKYRNLCFYNTKDYINFLQFLEANTELRWVSGDKPTNFLHCRGKIQILALSDGELSRSGCEDREQAIGVLQRIGNTAVWYLTDDNLI